MMETIKAYVYYPCLNLYWDSQYYLGRAIDYVSATLFAE